MDLGLNDLQRHLRDQIGFLDSSCDSYDRGARSEAYRLATSVRVLVHDTNSSHSLLAQLQIKDSIRYIDGRGASFDKLPPLAPDVVNSAPGLAVIAHFYFPEGNSRDAAEYWPAFQADNDPLANKPLVTFEAWWKSNVSTDMRGNRQFRRHFILAGANKDGGAHVDTKLDGQFEGYRALTRDGSMGSIARGSVVESRLDPTALVAGSMSPALAIMRHIAEELRVGLRLQVPHLLGEFAATPPSVDIETPFMFTGDRQMSGSPGFTIELGPQPIE